ncbi:hypothetical protein BS78_01G253200 [Paspalum vaginatum]|nr:hypothetical protein BS78_01G253200 [Paspalum vaginatum]
MADTAEEREVPFKKFVNRFLMLRNPIALDEFEFCYKMSCYDLDAESEDANLWIRHALEVLDDIDLIYNNIRADCFNSSFVMSSWQDAESVKVTVRYELLRFVPTVFASGRSLTKLHLSSVQLSYGFFRHLETRCKALKQLFLDDCCISDAEITSNTLKVLTIDMNCRFMFDEQPSISIPSLVYFTFSMKDGTKIPFPKEHGITGDSITCLDQTSTPGTWGRMDLPGGHAPGHALKQTAPISFGGCLTLVSIHINSNCITYNQITRIHQIYPLILPEMENNTQWCPEFNNLTTLTLDRCCLYPGFYPSIVFLQNSRKLESLTLHLSFSGDAHVQPRLERRLFSCVDLHRIDITICQGVRKDHPLLVSLEKLLTYNGIDSREIRTHIRDAT